MRTLGSIILGTLMVLSLLLGILYFYGSLQDSASNETVLVQRAIAMFVLSGVFLLMTAVGRLDALADSNAALVEFNEKLLAARKRRATKQSQRELQQENK